MWCWKIQLRAKCDIEHAGKIILELCMIWHQGFIIWHVHLSTISTWNYYTLWYRFGTTEIGAADLCHLAIYFCIVLGHASVLKESLTHYAIFHHDAWMQPWRVACQGCWVGLWELTDLTCPTKKMVMGRKYANLKWYSLHNISYLILMSIIHLYTCFNDCNLKSIYVIK